MSDITRGDICRYYGGSKKVNGLEPVDGRKSAQPAPHIHINKSVESVRRVFS